MFQSDSLTVFKKLQCQMLDACDEVVKVHRKWGVGVYVCIYAHASKVRVLSGTCCIQRGHACQRRLWW